MIGFDNTIKTLEYLQGSLEEFKNILIQSDKDPEILLTEYVLPAESDRIYVLTRLMVDFGEEGFNAFISEYFEKILKTLSWKIPINELQLTPTYFEDEYVIIGLIDNVPRMIINTFEKTISYIPDNTKLQLLAELDECNALISDLEQQLELVSADSDKITLNKKKHAERIKGEANSIVMQLSVEKQNLARLKEELENIEYDNRRTQDTLDRYASRLQKYYQYQIIRTEDLEQHIPESE